MKAWHDLGHRDLLISVNVSAVQFAQPQLQGQVADVLRETGLDPQCLELEITEGVFINDFSRAVSVLRRLKSLGVQIALDDFGTGYSCLGTLRSFPFDKIKIDRSFINDVSDMGDANAIVQATTSIASTMNPPNRKGSIGLIL